MKKDLLYFLGLLLFLIVASLVIICYNTTQSEYAADMDKVITSLGLEVVLPSNIKTQGKIYYSYNKSNSGFILNLYGKLSQEALELFMTEKVKLGAIGAISYNDNMKIGNFSFFAPSLPKVIMDEFRLYKVNDRYKSHIDDNMIYFQWNNNEYRFRLYILGKCGYFILTIFKSHRV